MATTGERPGGTHVRSGWLFAPRLPQDWFSADKRVSCYNTSALKETLERLVDFDRINRAKDVRKRRDFIDVSAVRQVGRSPRRTTP